LDEATLQSYFDGELSTAMMESATAHLASCETCAAAARELEQETLLLTDALAAEFEASVPTERLRQRIDAAVLGVRVANASASEKSSGFLGSLSGLFNFVPQRTLGYASLVLVLAFGLILGVVKMRTTSSPVVETPKQEVAIVQKPTQPVDAGIQPAHVETPQPGKRSNITRPMSRKPNNVAPVAPRPAPVQLMPGERAYLQTIAKLDSSIKADKKMRPALQVEYERNLAVVDRAIAATRSAAKSNPTDPDAADFMFAAYQSKVDLLNTIADARVGGRSH
jgi:hypothetical protein